MSSLTIAQQHYSSIGRPYLQRYSVGGALEANAIAQSEAGPGGVLAHIFVRMFKGFRPRETINSLLNTNGGGKISFDQADPIIASWYADTPDSGLGMAGSHRALKGVSAAFRVNSYVGLGHSLGPAQSAIEDELLPIAAQPLDDMAVWLRTMLTQTSKSSRVRHMCRQAVGA